MSGPLASLAGLILMFGVPPQDTEVNAAPNAGTASVPQELFESVALPYEGPGRISLLKDGALIVTVGEAFFFRNADGDLVLHDDEQVFGLVLDITGLTLIQAGNEWFLDRDGAEVRARALLPADITATTAYEPVQDAESGQSFLSVSGQMALSFDARTGVYRIEVWNAEGGKIFTGAFRALPQPPAQEQAAPGYHHCECEVTCADGSHCSWSGDVRNGYSCKCYCDPSAICTVIKDPKKVELVIVQEPME